MLGLAILFFLAVWIGITFLAARFGYQIGSLKGWPKLGAFAGFMLTMGGFWVYWAIEFAVIQAKVSHLCETEGGVTVYVTPEQWRKEIGKEEWKKSVYTGNPDQDYPKDSVIEFNNRKYKIRGQINQRILRYHSNDNGNSTINGIYIWDFLFYDKKSSQVLYHQRVFNPSRAGEFDLRFWLRYGVHSCNLKHKYLDGFDYSYIEN